MILLTGVMGDHRKNLMSNATGRGIGLSSPEKEVSARPAITRLLDHISHKKDYMCLPLTGVPI